jgi:hypothetical protein
MPDSTMVHTNFIGMLYIKKEVHREFETIRIYSINQDANNKL